MKHTIHKHDHHFGWDNAITPVDAYILCSVCGDLRINEIVDRPN
ncbi:MAG: hypothetical protein QF738_03275 [Rhodospirillales bacterium]|nr:hypothetical protein [Rhodospirillales bacterium]